MNDKAIAAKQIGMAKGAEGKHAIIALAKREAITMAQYGPVTIDDVSTVLEHNGVDPTKPSGSPRMWKGSVFKGKLWRCIGRVPSRFEDNHCRTVNVWALKSWIQQNNLNGTDWIISAFRINKILAAFKRKNPLLVDCINRCNWVIGIEELNDDVMEDIKQAGNMLFGIPVTFIEGGVGALIMPPAPTPQPVNKADVKPTSTFGFNNQ